MNSTGTRVLQSHRLILRPFRMDDADAMFANWASDPEVTRYLTWPAHRGKDVTEALLREWISRYSDGLFFNWAVEWSATGQVIGNISVVALNEETESAEIGYCLGKAFWGQGIMPEALRTVMGYLFDVVGVRRVCAGHDRNNPKSGRVMEKAGMKQEGILRGAGKNNQGICDMVLYAMMRDEWKPIQKESGIPVQIREATENDLDRVNELRREVNELHVAGNPEIFRPGFGDALRDYIYEIHKDPNKKILVAEQNGKIHGFAVVNHIVRPENPFMLKREFLDIDELSVDAGSRRQGIATAMVRYVRQYAQEIGVHRIELNMWAWNRGALAFYEETGFTTYRRYLKMSV